MVDEKGELLGNDAREKQSTHPAGDLDGERDKWFSEAVRVQMINSKRTIEINDPDWAKTLLPKPDDEDSEVGDLDSMPISLIPIAQLFSSKIEL